MWHRSTLFLLIFVTITVCTQRNVTAYELVDNEKLQLRLMGWARVRYVVEDALNASLEHDTRIRMARLVGAVDYRSLGSAFIQLEANTGDVLLLDAFARFTPNENLEIRGGLFPTRVAMDTQLLLPSLPFGERPASIRTGLVPFRRLGFEVAGRLETSSQVKALLNLGVYDPTETRQLTLDNGKLMGLFAQLVFPSGFATHASFLALVGGGNETDASGQRPLPYDQQISASLAYDRGPTRAYLEGVVVMASAQEHRPFSVYAWVAHMFPVADFKLQPAVRYEIFRPEERVQHQLTTALNLLLLDWLLAISANYEATFDRDEVGHFTFAQLQIGF